jgi:hypothetical protein
VKLVISDAHEGLKAAIAKVLSATWQRCCVHFMRNALAHAGKTGRRVVSAFVATAFAQDDAGAVRQQWRRVADQLRPKVPKLATLMDQAEPDVLAYMTFPRQHRAKLHSTNPLERLNGAIGRHVLSGEAIFADDTPVRMLAPGTGRTQTARLWTYARDERPWGGSAPPAAWYRFSADRKGQHPKDHLARFRGWMHADGYAGFEDLYRSGAIREVACMAHVRRKFVDIHQSQASATVRIGARVPVARLRPRRLRTVRPSSR